MTVGVGAYVLSAQQRQRAQEYCVAVEANSFACQPKARQYVDRSKTFSAVGTTALGVGAVWTLLGGLGLWQSSSEEPFASARAVSFWTTGTAVGVGGSF